MSKKGVEDMIKEIEMFIDSCKFQAFSTDRIVVPKSELEAMLNELRLKLPSEMERSKKIMRNKESILSDARTRAEALLNQAADQAQRMVDESEIMTMANLRAEEIMRQTNADRNAILEQANRDAIEIRLGMMEYSTSMLNDIEKYINQTMEVEKQNYSNLIASLQNNAEVIEANRREIEEQHLALIKAQQPVVEPEPQYQDSAFPQSFEETAQPAMTEEPELIPEEEQELMQMEQENEPNDIVEDEIGDEDDFGYDEDDDELF